MGKNAFEELLKLSMRKDMENTLLIGINSPGDDVKSMLKDAYDKANKYIDEHPNDFNKKLILSLEIRENNFKI